MKKFGHFFILVIGNVLVISSSIYANNSQKTVENVKEYRNPPPPESEIMERILDKENNNKNVRPEPNGNDDSPLSVHFELKVQKIVKLDVKKQSMTIKTFIRMRWEDPRLTWNISHFDQVWKVNIDPNEIWTPDIVLYNSATETSFSHLDLYKTKALIYYNGSVTWNSPITWEVSCGFDVTWFPIDKQVCTLTFGSWTYMSDQLRLSLFKNDTGKSVHAQFGVNSGEWKITDLEMSTGNTKYDCCPLPFSIVNYQFSLNRMALYYFLYIILPLMSQVFLFLMIFHIPYDGGERMGFGVTILLSITVYLLVISEKLPEKSDDRPLLGICFIVEFYVLCVGLICAGITTKLSSKNSKPPAIIMKIFRIKGYQIFGSTTAIEKILVPEEEIMLEMTECNGYIKGQDQGKISNESTKNIATAPEDTLSEGERNNQQWKAICDKLDWFFFVSFLIIMLAAPMLIFASLDHTMLGEM